MGSPKIESMGSLTKNQRLDFNLAEQVFSDGLASEGLVTSNGIADHLTSQSVTAAPFRSTQGAFKQKNSFSVSDEGMVMQDRSNGSFRVGGLGSMSIEQL